MQGSGVHFPPHWSANILVAVVRFRPPSDTIDVVWCDGTDAHRLLSRITDAYVHHATKDTFLYVNRGGEVMGFTDKSHALFTIPIAGKVTNEALQKQRTYSPCRFSHGPETVVTEFCFDRQGNERSSSTLSGETALEEILILGCDPTAELLGGPCAVYGAKFPDGHTVEFWDMNQNETWQEYTAHEEALKRRMQGQARREAEAAQGSNDDVLDEETRESLKSLDEFLDEILSEKSDDDDDQTEKEGTH